MCGWRRWWRPTPRPMPSGRSRRARSWWASTTATSPRCARTPPRRLRVMPALRARATALVAESGLKTHDGLPAARGPRAPTRCWWASPCCATPSRARACGRLLAPTGAAHERPGEDLRRDPGGGRAGGVWGAGADALGLNFYARSPRCVAPGARRWPWRARGLPLGALVGVFVNESPEDIRARVRECGLDGGAAARRRAPRGVRAAMACRSSRRCACAAPEDVERARAYVGVGDVAALLLDGAAPGYGGGGVSFDWSLVARLADAGVPVLVAGGLNPANVAEAVQATAALRSGCGERGGGPPLASRMRTRSRAFVRTVEEPLFAELRKACDDAKRPRAASAATVAAMCRRRWSRRCRSSRRPMPQAAAGPGLRRARCIRVLREYVGRETPLTPRTGSPSRGAAPQVWLKREDLAHTGAHKINNTIGQVLLARRMGKTRIIAETGAGQHGVATATACALLRPPVRGVHGRARREASGAQRRAHAAARAPRCTPVESGSRTLKDAMNEAMRDWVTHVRDTYYCIGSAAGPAPVPQHRARLPGRHRRRGARAAAGARSAGCRTPWSRAWAAARNAIGAFARLPRRRQRAADRRGGGGRGHRTRVGTPRR